MDPSFIRLHSESEFTRAPAAPRFLVGESISRLRWRLEIQECAVWMREQTWRKYARFTFQKKLTPFWRDQFLAQGTLETDPPRTIERAGERFRYNFHFGECWIDFIRTRKVLTFRWRWLGEECALSWDHARPRPLGQQELGALTIGSQELRVVLTEPPDVLIPANRGYIYEIFGFPPRSDYPGDWLQPPDSRIEPENAHIVLLLCLLLRGLFPDVLAWRGLRD